MDNKQKIETALSTAVDRRTVLRGILGGVGLVALGACGGAKVDTVLPSPAIPNHIPDTDADRQKWIDRLAGDFNMAKKLNIRHPFGINVDIFSDGDILAPQASTALRQVIDDGLSSVDFLPSGRYKTAVARARDNVASGMHAGSQLDFFVSSRPDTFCGGNMPFDVIPEHMPPDDPAFQDPNLVIYPGKRTYMVAINAAVKHEKAVRQLGPHAVENAPDEIIARTVSHETIHLLELLEQIQRDEALTKHAEGALEQSYQLNPGTRPMPFILAAQRVTL